MLKLYFGNLVNTVTTLLLVVLLGFIGVSICHRAAITGWGRRTLLALVLGLVICCFAAARDGLAGIHSGQIFLQIHSYLLQVGCGGVSRRKRRWNGVKGRGSA